ncbi:MAG TPA: pilus assembly protein TadG-related protein, partial [Pirellulaceae bacterium]|nr:pilus assembly protein TadG-related protein [Pirellulaceae bacterium]
MNRRLLDRRRGAIAVLSAFLSIGVLAMAAFVVDLGIISHARTELQRTADAAALTAAAQLPDQAAALSVGISTSGSNSTAVSPILNGSDIEFGWWDRESATFLSPPPMDRDANAVRVSATRSQASGNPMTLFYGRMWNQNSADVSAWAIAMNNRGLCGPLIGIQSLTASGNITTDSFDSAKGSYHAATAGNRGNLCSNGPITINGPANIRGSVRSGVSDRVTMRSARKIVTGNVGSRVKPLELPPVNVAEVAWNNDNVRLGEAINGARDFELAGDHVFAIPTGIYYLNNLDLRGSSVLKVTGETVIILTGDLNGTGGSAVNNHTELPSNLRIFATGGTIKLAGNKKFHGVVYAPQSDVDIAGTADIFGAIVGQNLRIHGDAAAHYDESL